MKYDGDREDVLKRARDNNVSMICVGTDLEMSRGAIDLAESSKNIWASVGLHPNDNLGEVYDQSEYEALALHERVVAIGEIGLDYYRTTDDSKKEFQRERFLQQLQLAKKMSKPVIIHCRDAHEDMRHILKERTLSGVIHSFTGTKEDARAYINLGFMIGLNGISTFARQYDEAIASMPLESILLETDAPYLSPAPYRGKRNEPSYIIEVARKISELKKASLEEICAQTTINAQKLFNL